jgi:hypothetical protein
MLRAVTLIWLTLLTLGVLGLAGWSLRPVPPPPEVRVVVGGDDVAVDPASLHCYRLGYLASTDRYPAAVVTLDGVTCPYGRGE